MHHHPLSPPLRARPVPRFVIGATFLATVLACGGRVDSAHAGDRPARPSGKQTADCPGLVYGAGKREICLPLGRASFADEVIGFTPGERRSHAPFDDPQQALAEPNYRRTSSPDFISLGCDGALVLRFTDNVLVDIDGVDLHVFEAGPFVERTALAISADGQDWVDVGVIEGARADVDIAPFADSGEKYPYVRLRNAGKSCGGKHAGADIDAVAAVGAELRFSLDSALLFDVDESRLKPEARAQLDAMARELASRGKAIRLTIEGHTDSTGSDARNQALSEARAGAVAEYLERQLGLPPGSMTRRGFGATRPVASNDTAEGRARNRRVDLLVATGTSAR